MTYRTVTIDDLYNKHSEPTLDLYVYTIETNPKGAGKTPTRTLSAPPKPTRKPLASGTQPVPPLKPLGSAVRR